MKKQQQYREIKNKALYFDLVTFLCLQTKTNAPLIMEAVRRSAITPTYVTVVIAMEATSWSLVLISALVCRLRCKTLHWCVE